VRIVSLTLLCRSYIKGRMKFKSAYQGLCDVSEIGLEKEIGVDWLFEECFVER
jgi:hypothetical protein